MNEEKVKIKLTIAGESFVLTAPYSRQEEIRRTEAEVNMLFDTWRSRFPEKSDRELLGMIAFRYADRYSVLLNEREEVLSEMSALCQKAETLSESREAGKD